MKLINPECTTLGEFELAKENGVQLRVIVNGCAREGYLLGDYFIYKSVSPTCSFFKLHRLKVRNWKRI